MIKTSELIKFLKRRYKYDTKQAFICRLLRFGIIGAHMPLRELRTHNIRNSDYSYIVKNIQGNQMLLNPHDKGISSDLFLDDIREPLITQKFRECIKEGMICYDIGANIGYYALQEAQLIGDKGMVFAIEPIQNSCKTLLMNQMLNNYDNISVFNLAIGDEVGNGEIYLSPMSNMCSMVQKEGYRDYLGKLPIKVQTLDNFIEGKPLPDIVRMDTEGYEVKIVKGMEGLFKKDHPLTIFIEIHFDVLQMDVIPMLWMLKKYGFKVKYAAYEPHSATKNSVFRPLVNVCERVMGASGYVDISIDDMMLKQCFLSGQVENMEVIFQR